MNFLKEMYGVKYNKTNIKKQDSSKIKEKLIEKNKKNKEKLFYKKMEEKIKFLNFSYNRLDNLNKKIHNKLNEVIKYK